MTGIRFRDAEIGEMSFLFSHLSGHNKHSVAFEVEDVWIPSMPVLPIIAKQSKWPISDLLSLTTLSRVDNETLCEVANRAQ